MRGRVRIDRPIGMSGKAQRRGEIGDARKRLSQSIKVLQFAHDIAIANRANRDKSRHQQLQIVDDPRDVAKLIGDVL